MGKQKETGRIEVTDVLNPKGRVTQVIDQINFDNKKQLANINKCLSEVKKEFEKKFSVGKRFSTVLEPRYIIYNPKRKLIYNNCPIVMELTDLIEFAFDDKLVNETGVAVFHNGTLPISSLGNDNYLILFNDDNYERIIDMHKALDEMLQRELVA